MPTEQELDKLGNPELAMLCGKIAAEPAKYTEAAADRAVALGQEWASFQTSDSAVFREQQGKIVELASWRKRTLEFLAVIL